MFERKHVGQRWRFDDCLEKREEQLQLRRRVINQKLLYEEKVVEAELPKLQNLDDIIELVPDQREQLRFACNYREQMLSRVVHAVIESEPPVRSANAYATHEVVVCGAP